MFRMPMFETKHLGALIVGSTSLTRKVDDYSLIFELRGKAVEILELTLSRAALCTCKYSCSLQAKIAASS